MSAKNDTFRLDLSRLAVLVVEDNANMRSIIKIMVSGFGVRSIYDADNGLDGYEAYRSINPDMILTDWGMPKMSGVAMTRKIRCSSSVDPLVPIIMMSSNTEKHRVLEARDVGITEFLAKPMSATSLYLRIANSITNPRPFVRTAAFFGPDRRRFVHPTYDGFERRIPEDGSRSREIFKAQQFVPKKEQVAV